MTNTSNMTVRYSKYCHLSMFFILCVPRAGFAFNYNESFLDILDDRELESHQLSLVFNLTFTEMNIISKTIWSSKHLEVSINRANTSYEVINCLPSNQRTLILAFFHNLSNFVNFSSYVEYSERNCGTLYFKPIIFSILLSTSDFPSTNSLEMELLPIADQFSIDSDFYIGVYDLRHSDPSEDDNGRINLLIYETYKTFNTSIVEKIFIGTKSRLISLSTLTNKTRRYNFRGNTIRSIIFNDNNFRRETNVNLPSKFVSKIGQYLNFSIEIIPGFGWISFASNGSLQGIGRQLAEFEGDVLSQFNELSIERFQKFDFIYPITTLREEAFFRLPPMVSKDILFRPYSRTLWSALAITLTILALFSLLLQFRFRPAVFPISMQDIAGYIGNSMLWAVSLLTQQGWEELHLPTYSLKLLTLSGFILTSFFYQIYTASIWAIIASRDFPNRTFNEVVSTGLEVLVDWNSRNAHRFVEELPKDGISQVPRNVRMLTTSEGMKRIMTTPSVLLSYSTLVIQTAELDNISLEHICETSIIPLRAKGLPIYNGMYVRKHWAHRKAFLQAHMRMRENGELDRTNKYYLRLNTLACEKTPTLAALSFSVLSQVFLTLPASILISLIYFITEVYCSRFCRSLNSKSRLVIP